jgi:hypothetical protein
MWPTAVMRKRSSGGGHGGCQKGMVRGFSAKSKPQFTEYQPVKEGQRKPKIMRILILEEGKRRDSNLKS